MTQSFDIDVVPDAANPNLIHVRTPGGGAAKVPRSELARALQQGATPMTPEEVDTQRMQIERGTLGQQALTFGEAGLSTLTLGASDFIGKQLDPEWAQATKERREVNPNITLAGEIVGAVAPAIASGGSSLGARAVSAVGAPMAALGRAGLLAEGAVAAGARAAGLTGQSLAGRAVLRGLTSAASGALEGGVFEITRGMVSSVLDDTEYTAEKLTADIKKGVKWGAIGGGVVGVGSTLIGAAGRKAADSILQGRTLEEAAKDIADNRHVRSVVGDLGALGERSKEIGQKIVAADIPMTGGAAAREAVEAHASRAVDDLVAAARKLDEAGIAVPQSTANRMRKLGMEEVTDALDVRAPSPVRRAPERTIAELKRTTDELLARLPADQQDELIKLSRTLSKMEGVTDSAALRSALDGVRLNNPTQYGTLFRGMPMTRDDIARLLESKVMRADYHMPLSYNEDLSRIYPLRVPPEHEAVLLRVRDADDGYSFVSDRLSMELEEVLAPKGSHYELLEHHIEPGGKHIFDVRLTREAPKPRSGPWEALAKARKAADDPEAFDTMLASVDGVVDDALVSKAAAGDEAARAVVAQHDAAKGALGKAIEDARDWGRLSKVLRRSDEVKDVSGKVMGAVEILRTLAMGGIGGIPGMAMSAASAMGRRFLHERGSLWLAKMAKGMARADSRVSRAVKGLAGEKAGIAAAKTSTGIVGEPDWTGELLDQVFSEQSPAAPAVRRAASIASANYEERYDQLVSQVRTFRDDPKEAAEILDAVTGALAEEHPEVAAAVHRQILSDAAYIDSRLGLGQRISLNPLSPRLPVTREEKLVALDIADALNDPPAVFEELASGRYNAEQWAALEARRPKLYNEFRSQAMRELLPRYDEIATERRVMVGTALQFPADWSMVPENGAALMALSAPPEEAQQTGGPSVNPNAAEMMATPSQAAINGG